MEERSKSAGGFAKKNKKQREGEKAGTEKRVAGGTLRRFSVHIVKLHTLSFR